MRKKKSDTGLYSKIVNEIIGSEDETERKNKENRWNS